ncbi:unnamed protein product [Acanthoscelides obtectus]|uniref:HECT-type E3 ubiquitin transferase n=1 Tax=Acanthoscelides obtectus TaxID=200917 RepID=A0A9P0NXK6_ACAOB|nr:unnamed protein product [Acanthoscelides obtectus]CAK1627958.1 E3 ubiquitin-protein ligase HUWE1 [Acanthoscelides obtectus]
MKIDRSRVRKGTSDVPLECQQLIERLQNCSRTELLDELSRIHTWTFGKCELLHWASVLDIFDKILGQAAERAADNKYILKCDTYNEQEFQLLICILRFTSLLIEHSFSRHLYNSMEHLLVLLEANDMTVVLEVLNLLYMFSKRSNFITRLKPDEKECLLSRLQYLAESWGGKDNGFGLARCCLADQDIPPSATTLHVEFHKEEDSKTVKKDVKPIQGASKDEKQADSKVGTPNLYIIHIEHIDKLHKTAAEIMKSLTSMYYVPEDKEIWLFTHVRLATHFADYRNRLKNVQARLQALSVLVYSNAIQDSPANLLYNGILEELVEVVELQDPNLTDIKCAALRTLTAIIHLDRNPNVSNRRPGARLNSIIDVTGASQYHGFLPVLVRNCIASLTNQGDCGQNAFRKMKLQDEATTENAPSTTTEPDTPPPSTTAKDLMDVETDDPKDDSTSHETKFPVCLTTSLFSFLYHLASYEAGGEALVSCGMMESLLQVINWQGYELDHITFVTRAVRVIDLITNIDMAAFQMHGGLHSFINRLDTEVNLCKKEQLYQIKSSTTEQAVDDGTTSPSQDNTEESNTVDLELIPENADKTCLPQRAALLKSMLNFLKKAFQDSIFAESIRHLMEGTLPNSLKNIIANAEYYGPSLFLLATDVVTVYVYQEPALLSTLQDNGLTDVVLHSLLVKEIPATREVLGSLPNVFSALCLNNRGLESFAKYKPFEILFNILLSPNYLPAMRRRRSSEPTADTACNLGSAMDELMRHQPSLRQDATLAIIKLLEELVVLGTDPQYVCWRPHSKSEVSPSNNTRSPANTEGSSDEEEDDEEETSTSSQNAQSEPQAQASSSSNSTRTPVALIEYILNAMKFIDAILSNNSTDDHCREFVEKGGLSPLLKILGLPNLPVDCPVTNPAQAVATVCKSILNLAHEPFLFSQGLTQLGEVLETLKPLYTKQETPGGSKLLLELASASDIESAFSNAAATPLLHAMNAAHGYVIMFVHICRTGQTEIRNLSLQHWGSDSGMQVLKGLADLYTSLVWESTLLLAYCSDDLLPTDCDFTREDIEKLNAFFDRCEQSTAGVDCAGTVASAMEALSTNPTPLTMDVDGEGAATINTNRNLKYIKPLLGASSRLGRALAELFGLLVKLCVGSPIRQRRGQNMVAAPPIPSNYARNVATALNELLAEGLDCDRLPPCPTAKCRLTFLICSVGFTSPMLFDERRYPYHLMLKKFVSLGGLSIFFKTFKWAINAGKKEGDPKAIDHSSLPEGTLGFLDAWLTLLEKMVNPKAILESPHMISSRPIAYNFDPLNYLRHIHSAAFECVMLLWGISPLPNYGARTTDTLLTILRHIFRGEKIIKDKMKTDEKSDTASSSAAAGTSAAAGSSGNSGSNSNFRDLEDRLLDLRQLMDMGFSREHAIEALLHSHNLEQATDYILSNPAPMARVSMDVEEDDQVLQAIAISLGCTNTENKDNLDETESYESLIDEFTNHALDVCLKLLEVIPETVHKVCELLVTIMKRNGRVYRDSLLDTLISKIQECIADISFCTLEQEANVMSYYTMVDSDPAKCMSDYVHLYILFFEVSSYFDMKIPCGYAIHRAGLLEPLIELLCCAVKYMLFFKADHEPKWVAPSFLLLDAVSKVATCTSRKLNMHMSTTRTWRWYDLVTGKWTHYSTSNNKLINEAYWNGEQSIRVTCGRKRYTVTFANMLQMNDETGNNRPITMTLMSFNHPACIDINAPDYEPLYADLTEKEGKRCTPVPGLSLTQKQEIVKTCVKLMHMPIDKDLLHSALQICVRFTRDFSVAKVFVESGGIKCLLNMKQINDFGGFAILATILIRHALEEPSTLKYAMEKIIRGRTLSTIPPPYKDLIYLARNVGGAITRDPETFYEVASNIMRVDINVMKEEPVEASLPIRVEPPVRSKPPPMESTVSIGVVWDLLDALLRPLEEPVEDKHAEAKFGGQKLRVVVHEGLPSGSSTTSGTSASNMTQPSSTSGISTSDISCFESATTTSSQASQNSASQSSSSNNENAKTSGEPKKTEASKKPMLPKSVILKILADAVVSFGPIAKLITEYKYRAGYSEFITDDTSALAFIFDKILPGADNISDSDCSTMCRMLIAALASSNHSPDAQITLVSEVKVALTRALYLPESAEKHTQIQHICGIISTMIDNCPLPHASRWTSGSINNIVKLMIRRGVFSDLAKITHYLDLSSPNTSFTANAALKPLESLSRAINQPAPTSTQNKTKRNQHSNEDNNAVPSGTSTEATNAQGEEIEDAENTEHDISAVASSLENNAVGSGELDNALEEMMEHILEHRNNDNSQGYNDVPSSRNNTMDIDEECTIGGYDHERDATEELMSTDSGESDSNPSDQVDDEGNDDNEGDDDNMDDTEENEDTNYDDENNERERLRGSSGMFRIATNDRDEDILMIQYDADGESALPRMIRWNDNGFAVPLVDDSPNDHTGSVSVVTHPLLLSQSTSDSNQNPHARAHRANRARRYQYLFSPRNPNPPVILQRLLGPHDPHVTNIMSNNLLGGPTEIRESARVVVMDNFGIIPSNEEQIDFVDQSGYLFGPSLAATLSHIPPVLHWWNIESKLLDLESVNDCTIYVCNKLVPSLIKHRNEELRIKKAKEDEENAKKEKQKSGTEPQDEYSQETVLFNFEEAANTANENNEQNNEEEEENYDRVPIPETDRAETSAISADTPAEREDLDEDEEFHHEDEDDAIDIDAIEADGLLDIFQSEGQNNDVDNSLLLDESDNFFPGSDELSDSSDDEDIDGVPVDPSIYRVPLETSEASNDRSEGNTQNDDIVLSPLQMRFDRGSNENSQSSMSEVTHNAAVQTSESSENVQRTEENSRPDSEISRDSDSSNPFEMTLPASTRPVMLPRDLLSQPPNDSMLLTEEETDTLTSRLREQLRDSLHNLEQPGSITLRAFLDDAVNSRLLPPQSEMDALVIRMAGEATANLEEAVQNSLDEMLQSSLAEALTHTLNEAIQNNFGDSSLNNFETASHRQEPIQNPNIVDEASTSTTANQGSAAADATSAASDANAPGESGEGDHSSAAPQAPGGAAANDNGNPHDEGAAAGLGDAGTPGAVTAAGPSSSVNDDEIPEGVDPSFLEALPPEMRREVLEQHRILCLQQRIAASAAANAANAAGAAGENTEAPSNEVSPEFLAALPPALQEEVLTQQRLEQQRQAAARANPNEPVDAGAFFETLQPSLRTMILSDMEDSQMSALPPDLAAEAQTLRRDWYARNRQMAQQRLFQSNLTTIYRHSRGRQSLRATNFQRGGWSQWNRDFPNNPTPTSAQMKIRGRQLLDHDGISCLLILLFTDDPHLNKLRLHRVIRNLCYHGPTREWIINALLSIIEKSVHTIPDENLNKPSRKGPKPGPLSSKLVTDSKHLQNGGHWLTIRTEAALGCAANVFIVNKTTGKKCDKPNGSSVIAIHPQAAPIICKNTLDLFTSLAKAFPSCLLPLKCIRDDNDKNIVQPIKVKSDSQSDFWDVLLRLDSATKKGKSIQKNNSSSNNLDSDPIVTFDQTVFGKLLNMLASPVVNSNTQLTDNLLKLLSVTTSGMPELVKPHKSGKVKNQLPDMSANPPTHALSLAVNVITYKNCSEEGLEFITNLLLNLANSSLDMSFLILTLLLNGAIEIGSIVENQIKDMLKDLKDLIVNSQKRKVEDGPSTSKGVIVNRFTNEQVVVTASTKVKTACELQLPSMVPLTSKCSSQTFFLRVLRVIVHIRNSIKNNLKKSDTWAHEMPALSEQLGSLKNLWDTLSECLLELEHAPDHHAVLVLQPAVEAFFLVHSPQQGPIKPKERQPDRQLDEEELMADNNEPEQQDQPAEQEQVQAQEQQPTQDGQDQETAPQAAQPQQPDHREDNTTAQIDMSETVHQEHVRLAEAKSRASVPPDQQQFLQFAEKHRTVLNQILRQSTAHLADGPFAVLVDHTRILDFDIKRRYFRTELERMDHGIRREETAVHVRRSNIFEDSFRELFRRPPEEWKNRFYIVFEDEEGQDAGGLLREWYVIISRDIFNPMYALFTVSPGDRVTYMINSASHYNSNHLCYYKFVGRVIAKAIYDNKLLECYFTRSFYKHILGIPVKYTDMESEDYSFYRGLIYLIENNINNLGLDLTFSTEISEFGVTETRDLIPNGRHINVTEENKMEYVRLVCQMKMTGAIKQQLNSFLEGFYDIIPMRLISIFNEQELELLISGLPNVDIDDLKANTEYHKYQTNSLQIQWFWRALRSFDQAERAKFLQFVTGTSKVPLQGFGALEGMNGVQKFQIHRDDRSTDRLPSAHTCFNQLDLPVYETYDKLRAYLLKAIHECSEGFGFA